MKSGPPNFKASVVLFCWHGDLENDRGGGNTLAIDRLRFLIGSGFDVHLLSRTRSGAAVTAGCREVWQVGDSLHHAVARRRFRSMKRNRIGWVLNSLGLRKSKKFQQLIATEQASYDNRVSLARNAKQSGQSPAFRKRRMPPLIGGAAVVIDVVKPDIVFVSFAWNAVIFDSCPPETFKIIDTHDIQHRRAIVASAAGGNLDDRDCSIEEECGELGKADLLLGIQSDEAAILEQLCVDVRVVTAGHSPPVMAQKGSPGDSNTLLFIANLYDPNVIGLQQFLLDDWPALRGAGWNLKVIGKVCNGFSSPVRCVEFLGVVDDLRPHYDEAAIVLNLAAYSTGLPIKTVEGLAAGKVVLARVECSECFDDDVPIVRFRSGQAADALRHLVDDVAMRRNFCDNAVKYAWQGLAPSSIYRDFQGILVRHALWPEAN
jgi:hypothetical protein